VEQKHQNLPDKILMIMRVNTYEDKVKDLPENRQRQDKHLHFVIVVEPNLSQQQSFVVSVGLSDS
jgi:hypothetical protein